MPWINPQQPLTVCYVLQNLNSLDGKIIQVRGEWYGGYMEEECKTELITEDLTWPDAIYLIGPERLHEWDEPVDWIFAFDDFMESFNEANRYKSIEYAKIVGRLDARAEVTPDPKSGDPRPFGYGHLGA